MLQITIFKYILKYNAFLWCKAEFSASLLQCSVSHDPSEKIVLKAAVRKFCFFVAISVWKPGIAVTCWIISLTWGFVSRHGSSVDESNVLRSMCGSQSLHRCGCLLYFTITESSLRLGIYDPNNNFNHILSSEQVSNKSATFVLINWWKKH